MIGAMSARVLALLLASGLAGCGGGESRGAAPGGAARSNPPSPSGAAAPADPNDPAEPGIPDLARLARYVFRTMQRHEAVCALDNPFRDTLHFAFAIEVERGRMSRVELGEVALEGPIGRLALLQRQWPPELVAYVECLETHLKAVAMDPAPADGSYRPFYSFKGLPEGRPIP